MIGNMAQRSRLSAIHARVETEIAGYVRICCGKPDPDPEDAVKHVYADIEVEGR